MRPVAYHFDESLDHMGYTKGDEPFPYGTLLYDEDDQAPLLQFFGTKPGSEIPERPTFAEIADKENTDWAALGDSQIAATLAENAIRSTRFLMKRGTLNNLMPVADALNPEKAPPIYNDPTHRPEYLCEPLSPGYLDNVANTVQGKIVDDGRDHHLGGFANLLGRYYTGVRLQAGVCSNVSAVTIGMLTVQAPVVGGSFEPKKPPKDGELQGVLTILDLSHSGKHSFCLVSYGRSPWFVCDPWVAEPYVIPFEENYFPPDGVLSWSEIRVHRRLEHPFGLPSMALWNEDHGDEKHNVENFPVDHKQVAAAEQYLRGIGFNADANMMPEDAFDKNSPNLKAYRLHPPGENVVSRRMAAGFHVGSVWTHETNHGLFEDQAQWLDYRKNTPPVVRGNEWGDRVNMQPGGSGDLDADERRESGRVG